MITGVNLNNFEVSVFNNSLVYSCNDLSVSCTVDSIGSSLLNFIERSIESWRSGKNTNFLFCGGSLQEILPIMSPFLQFPLNCKILESNKYRKLNVIEEWVANNISEVFRNLVSQNSNKALSFCAVNQTFITNNDSSLTILPLKPKVSMKIDE